MRWLVVAGVFSVWAVACDDAAHPPAPRATWHDDIAPLVARHCIGCHAPGGVGPLPLDTLAHARLNGPLALGEIEEGLMPPWLPSTECQPLADARLLNDDEKAAFRAWVEDGMAAGRPGPDVVTPALEPRGGFLATESHAVADGYVPSAASPDDYHCFVLDRDFAEDTYVVGSDVEPGSGQVHHAIVYAIKPAQLAEMEQRDAAEAGPGYSCFAQPISTGFADQSAFMDYLAGGVLPNFDFPIQLGAWVPGIAPRVLAPGTAYRVPAGSKLVVQIHYSLQGAPTPDDTRLSLMTTTTPPRELLTTRPLAVLDLDIPAGAPDVQQARAFAYYGAAPLELVGGMAHMHLLGSGFSATLVRGGDPSGAGGEADASGDQCLLDLPRWDFHWQESYSFADGARVAVHDGDHVRVECDYDNSAAHQAPGPDGVVSAPRDVTWGESTRDEMCIYYYTAIGPFTPVVAPPAVPCAPAAGCVAACGADGSPPSLDCLLACADASVECQLCGVRATLQCSDFSCLGTLVEHSECLTTCLESSLMLGSNLGRCLAAECPDGYEQALQCLDHQLDGCADRLATCGVDFAAGP